jgi:hypothetical protein
MLVNIQMLAFISATKKKSRAFKEQPDPVFIF